MRRAYGGIVAITSVVALLVAGCGDDWTAGATCGEGTEEQNGICVPIGGGLLCGEGTHEEGGECVADPVQQDGGVVTPATGPVGSACETAADCNTGLICATTALDPRMVGGYCTKLMCSASNQCPAGATCVDPGVGFTACFAFCEPGLSDDACREGYACQPLLDDPLMGMCAPACSSNDACPAGALCDADVGICVAPPACGEGLPACATDTTCFAGYCLADCSSHDDCKDGEVCQPTGAGSTDGVCAPPPCEANSDCPAGATCEEQYDGNKYCKPPVTCTGTCTETGFSCIAGLCLKDCANDTTCTDIHPDLVCALAAGAVCMPKGTFPSSPCLPYDLEHPDPWCLPVGGSGAVTQSCYGGMCVVDCNEGNVATGDALCAAVNSALTCMPMTGTAGFCVLACTGTPPACAGDFSCFTTGGQNACLPKGSFPFSACATGDLCDHVSGIPQVCMDGTCVPTCANEEQCGEISSALTCVGAMGLCAPKCSATSNCNPAAVGPGFACMDSENACLPAGSFPGAPCTANNQCLAIGQVAQTCVGESTGDGMCTPMCTYGDATLGDSLCQAVSLGLKCMPLSEATTPWTGVCNYACIAGGCGHLGTGYTCMEQYQVCLPTGSFPGSPCKTGNLCDDVGGRTQSCVNDMCVPTCTNDTHCTDISGALTCLESMGLCVFACTGNGHDCDPGYSCYEPAGQNACIPDGSAPFYPCRLDGSCGALETGLGDLPMACTGGKCLVTCHDSGYPVGDTECGLVGTGLGLQFPLTCDNTYTKACMPACNTGSCGFLAAMGDFTCTDPGTIPAHQNACVPTGSFPFSPCREGQHCDTGLVCTDPDGGGTTFPEACYVDCSWNQAICTGMGMVCLDVGFHGVCVPN